MSDKKGSKRFNSEKSARGFALKVGGEFKDLREHPERKSDFKVIYTRVKGYKGTKDTSIMEQDWCPEEDRDFGYTNEYWKD